MRTILLALCLSLSGQAASYFVATTGSNANPGTSASPFLTIQKGVDVAVAGDTITVRDGTYGPGAGHCATVDGSGEPSGYAVNITLAATAGAHIVIRADHYRAAILDSQLICHSYFGMQASSAYYDIQGFQNIHGYWGGVNDQGVHHTFTQNEFHHIGNFVTNTTGGKVGILTQSSSDTTLIDSNSFHDIGRSAGSANNFHDQNLYLQGTNLTVTNNIFYNLLAGWAMAIKVGSNYLIANNTMYGPAGAGRLGQIVLGDGLGTPLTNVTIENNIFESPNTAGIVLCIVSLAGSSTFSNNMAHGAGVTSVYNSGNATCGAGSSGLGTITETADTVNNPLLTNAPAFDFHIPTGSPAVNAGLAIVSVTNDYDGNFRPRGVGWDIGAFEAASVSSPNTFSVYEVDGITQTARPITFGRAFARSEIAQCAQPVIGGTPVPTGNWQNDAKNRWPDGSLKFAVVSFIAGTFTAGGVINGTFQSAPCNNTGGLTQAQMIAFPGFGAAMTFKANTLSGPITAPDVDAKIMIGQFDPRTATDCRRNCMWLDGPVVTGVIIHDAAIVSGSLSSQNDLGMHWDGTNMLDNSGFWYTGNNQFASLHPMYILYFYPASQRVQVQFIVENDWTFRSQDQVYDLTLKTGSGLTPVLTRTGSRKITATLTTNALSRVVTASAPTFLATDVGMPLRVTQTAVSGGSVGGFPTTVCSLVGAAPATQANMCGYAGGSFPPAVPLRTGYIGMQAAMTRFGKTFWTGTNGFPGTIRIDNNFGYLISTKLIPNYDPALRVNTQRNGTYTEGYGDFVASDMADGFGQGSNQTWGPGWSNNGEGSPLQRPELSLLYNCSASTSFDGKGPGDANSDCAQAWQIMFGEKGAIDTNMANGPQQPTTLASGYTLLGGYPLLGGAGMSRYVYSVPYHLRESRINASGAQSAAQNGVYCPEYAALNSTSAVTGCTATGSATGTVFSRHAHSDGAVGAAGTQIPGVGSVNSGGGPNSISLDAGHWLDYSYAAYLLTGDYNYLIENQMGAAWLIGTESESGAAGNFSRLQVLRGNKEGARLFGWPLMGIGHAATISPDGTTEQLLFASAVSKNLQMLEGILNVTNTPVTPTSPVPSQADCATYNRASALPWDFGRCDFYNGGVNSLHDIVPGTCPKALGYGQVTGVVSTGTTTTFSYTRGAAFGTRPQGTIPLTQSYPISMKGVTGPWATGTTTNSTVTTPTGSCTTGVSVCAFDLSTTTPPTSTQFTINFNSTGLSPASWPAGVTFVGTAGTTEFTDAFVTQDGQQEWMVTGSITVGLGHLQESGITTSNGVMIETQKRAVEQMLDTADVKFYPVTYVVPAKLQVGTPNCVAEVDSSPNFTSWAQAKTAAAAGTANYNSFIWVNNYSNLSGGYPCLDHGYSTMLRAAVAYATQNNSDSTESGCPLVAGSPLCSASTAWNYVAVNGYAGGGGAIPYWTNAAGLASAGGSFCRVGDQVKFAIIPRAFTPPPGSGGTTLVNVTAKGVSVK